MVGGSVPHRWYTSRPRSLFRRDLRVLTPAAAPDTGDGIKDPKRWVFTATRNDLTAIRIKTRFFEKIEKIKFF